MLKINNLRKEFDSVVAVNDVSLEVKRGELFGLLGPNGAGKTTIIRTVLNIVQPDSGEITFNGKPFTKEMWNIIGYLPEERGLYRKSKIINTILYFSSLKGVPSKQAKSLAFYWLERFGLKNEGHRKIEELSKGNQQKIQLIISILHNPQLLILDEPFTGLDPVNQILLKDSFRTSATGYCNCFFYASDGTGRENVRQHMFNQQREASVERRASRDQEAVWN